MLPNIDTERRLQALERFMREIRGDRGAQEPGTWTPNFVNLTVVGAPTYAGRYVRIGRLVFFRIEITAGGANTTASVGGSTQMNNLPFTVAQTGTLTVSSNTVANYGVGWIQAGTADCYTPTWAATNQNITISGFYEV